MSGSLPHRPTVPGSASTPGSPRRRERRRPDGRIFWLSLGISAFLHIVLFWAARWVTFAPADGWRSPPRVVAVEEPRMRALRLTVTPDADAVAPASEPQREPEPDRAVPLPEPVAGPPEPSAVDAPAVEPPVDRPSAAERLAPRAVDPRLRPRFQGPPPPLTEEELLRQRVYASLRALADSALAADEAARRALDWTFTDGQGRRWGLSPGAVHLGGITIPLPLMLAVPNGRREEVLEMERRWAEIEAQAAREAVRSTVRERAEAMRERADREREARRSGTANGQGGGDADGGSDSDGG